VRALFAVARIKQPSIIFIDEIDSLLTQRSDSEHESSRRMKTEFLVQFDGLKTEKNERLLVIGATNRPQELDEAVRRRFTKRLYIPLPSRRARQELVSRLMCQNPHNLTPVQLQKLCDMTQGYSGADMSSLCQDAAMSMVRRVGIEFLRNVQDRNQLPPITLDDFLNAVRTVKATVSPNELDNYIQWNRSFGAIPNMQEDDDKDEESEKCIRSDSSTCTSKSASQATSTSSQTYETTLSEELISMDCQTSQSSVKTEPRNKTKEADVSVYIID
jgi:hypothetical protein